jgi:ankyrin repeat protein
LEDIGDQNWEYAHRLFQCVAAASRPLRVEELAEFLAFDFEAESTPEYLEDWRPEDPGHAVFSTCSSLLTVVNVGHSRVIQFAHFSVKEYLVSTRIAKAKDAVSRFQVSMTSAHTMVAQACLSVLLHIDNNIAKDGSVISPFVSYAAEHWMLHARFEGVSPNIQDTLKCLFDPNNRHLAMWVQIYDPASPSRRLNAGHGSQHPPQAMVTPLHYAAILGLGEIAIFLIFERSQDVNARDFHRNETPLCVASRWGHAEVARVLLENGADMEIRDGDYWRPLERAVENGHVEVVQVFLEHGADVNAGGVTNATALHAACAFGHPSLARVLLEHGADANAKEYSGETPLHWATDEEAVLILLEYGADSNAKDNYNWTPLDAALFQGQDKVARVLRENDAVANEYSGGVKTQDRWKTPLHIASANGQLADARVLLENGADTNAKGNAKETPLHCTSDEGVARLLLHYGADPNAPNNFNSTPLHVAMMNRCIEVADVLLDNGASLNSRDLNGRTPLHLASQGGYLDGVRLLLQHSSDVHAQDVWGMTPFHVASANRRHEATQLLLDNGAVDHRAY